MVFGNFPEIGFVVVRSTSIAWTALASGDYSWFQTGEVEINGKQFGGTADVKIVWTTFLARGNPDLSLGQDDSIQDSLEVSKHCYS